MYYTIEFLNRSTVSSPTYLNYVVSFDCIGSQFVTEGDPTNDDDYHLMYEAYVMDVNRSQFERSIDNNPDVVCWSVK